MQNPRECNIQSLENERITTMLKAILETEANGNISNAWSLSFKSV